VNQLAFSKQIVCRPAIESDYADVAEFCKGIWEGDDYVPEVWDQWFHDSHGILSVAESNGRAIGCSKISQIAEGQWWLEGFRVDPACQGRKVGSRLHQHVVDWWLKDGDGILRLMTDGQNFVVHHLCEKTGFHKTNEVCAYRAAALEEPSDPFMPVTDLRTAAAFIVESESIQTANGLADLGWRVCHPNLQVLESASNEHHFYWWKDQQGLFSAKKDEDEEKRTLLLGVVACSLENMPEFLRDIRRFAAGRKFDDVFQIAFDMPQIISPLLAAGFEKKWRRSNAFIFEKTHPKTA
jgi:GNAT superfamily N-acetyltransferase